MSRTLKAIERKQLALVEKEKAALRDARDLRKRGPRSGDLGQSFERQEGVIAARLKQREEHLQTIRALERG